MAPTDKEQSQADHDLLIEIKTTIGIILNRLDGFVTKSELQPIIDREQRCLAQFQNFVTKQEFKPIRMIVYGAVGLTLLTVAGAVLTLVVNRI